MNMYRERPVLWMASALCACVTLMLGAYLTLQPNPEIFTSVSYINVAGVFPFATVSTALRIWGLLYLAKGIAAVVGLGSRNWRMVALVALIGGLLWTAWAAIFFYTAIGNNWVGFVGACAFVLAAAMHALTGKAAAIWHDLRV